MPGLILIVIGSLIGLSTILTFIVKGSGTPAPFDPPVKFVATGPYRYVRNPMYIGGLTILAGWGLYVGSPTIIVCSFVWILIANLFVILYEEKTLKKRFGKSYEEYCRNVNRWIPKKG